jgi:hypothetical protein
MPRGVHSTRATRPTHAGWQPNFWRKPAGTIGLTVEASALKTARRGSARASAFILVGTSLRIFATPVVMGLVSVDWTAAAIVFLVVASTD